MMHLLKNTIILNWLSLDAPIAAAPRHTPGYCETLSDSQQSAYKRRSVSIGNAKRFQYLLYQDNKKRAAPPGRCSSCNVSSTPEWRRGPDGART